ncbi:MAG TPA: MarR family transcriptional regulator [Acidimicrobiia bacterium]|jgi:DNA-binding MarR family transcriptional regulator
MPGAATTTDMTTDLADGLRLAVTRLARRLRQQTDVDASPTQVALLSTIERRGPITLGDLAAHERVRPPTVTAAVGRLEERGLIVRRADPDDRRVVRVEVTPAGRRLLARARSRKTAFLAKRLAELDERDRVVLRDAVEVLDRVLEHGSAGP